MIVSVVVFQMIVSRLSVCLLRSLNISILFLERGFDKFPNQNKPKWTNQQKKKKKKIKIGVINLTVCVTRMSATPWIKKKI